jgi:hypothetical protein
VRVVLSSGLACFFLLAFSSLEPLIVASQVTVVDEQKIVVHDILNENVDELPEFRDRVIKVSLGE